MLFVARSPGVWKADVTVSPWLRVSSAVQTTVLVLRYYAKIPAWVEVPRSLAPRLSSKWPGLSGNVTALCSCQRHANVSIRIQGYHSIARSKHPYASWLDSGPRSGLRRVFTAPRTLYDEAVVLQHGHFRIDLISLLSVCNQTRQDFGQLSPSDTLLVYYG